MLAHEENTPAHLVGPHREAVSEEVVRGRGLAVLGGVLPDSEAARLRDVVVGNPAFKESAASDASSRSRYLHGLCEFASEGCKAWDAELLDLVAHDAVLPEIERILGSDCIVDSTALSIAWPGDGAFGPHIDRPFDANGGDALWSTSPEAYYGANGGGGTTPMAPPQRWPVSVQVVWALDNLTAANGAFFYVPGAWGSVPSSVDPEKHQLVTGELWRCAATQRFLMGARQLAGRMHALTMYLPSLHHRPRWIGNPRLGSARTRGRALIFSAPARCPTRAVRSSLCAPLSSVSAVSSRGTLAVQRGVRGAPAPSLATRGSPYAEPCRPRR